MGNERNMHGISILEILDESFSIYFSRIFDFSLIFLLLNIINMILTHIIRIFMSFFSPPRETFNSILDWLAGYGFYMIIFYSLLFLMVWVVTNLGNALITEHVSKIFGEQKEGFTRGKILLNALALSLLTGTLIVLGFISLIFPGILMSIIFSLAIPVMVVENLNVLDSLRRSKELTDGMWWKTFLLLFSILLLLMIASFLPEILVPPIYRGEMLKEILRVIIVSLVEPVYPVSLTRLYYILKEHKAIPIPVPVEQPPAETWEITSRLPRVKFCRYCGQLLPYDAVYCPNCGIKIEEK